MPGIDQLAPALDLVAAEPPGTVPFFFFQAAPYPFAETARDFQVIDPQLRADIRDAGYPTLYNSYTARGQTLDRTSIAAYLEQIVAGGLGSRLGQLARRGLQYRIRRRN